MSAAERTERKSKRPPRSPSRRLGIAVMLGAAALMLAILLEFLKGGIAP